MGSCVERYGYIFYPYKLKLKELKIPVILFVKIRKNEHFTVYRGMDETNIYLSDSSFGNMKIEKSSDMVYDGINTKEIKGR